VENNELLLIYRYGFIDCIGQFKPMHFDDVLSQRAYNLGYAAAKGAAIIADINKKTDDETLNEIVNKNE